MTPLPWYELRQNLADLLEWMHEYDGFGGRFEDIVYAMRKPTKYDNEFKVMVAHKTGKITEEQVADFLSTDRSVLPQGIK